LRYVPNPIARSLARGQNRLLGVFTYEAIFPVEQRDFYYPFLVGIEEAAARLGYDLLLFTGSTAEDGWRRLYQEGVNRLQLAAGAVLLGRGERKTDLRRLSKERFPFVYVGRREVPGTDISYVAADYVSATAEVVAHLAALGHHRVAYLGAPDPHEPARDREAGYRGAVATLRLESKADLVHRTPTISTSMMARLLKSGVTACLVEDDTLARQLENAVQTIEKRVPEDLSYVVLGNPLSPAESQPDWAFFSIPRKEMGERAAALLIEMVSSGGPLTPRHESLPCTFVSGRTVARVSTS
jgi:DNA-binding LacI/PurR family transcriptional regulator